MKTQRELEEMKYNELSSYAKQIGIDFKMQKKIILIQEIVEKQSPRILNKQKEVIIEKTQDENIQEIIPETEKPIIKPSITTSFKPGETKDFKDEKVFEFNYGIKFIELSAVVDPACPSCRIEGLIQNDEMLKKVANLENHLYMIKTAAIIKEAGKEKRI